MSESSITFTAVFDDLGNAEKTKNILDEATKIIEAADEELFLHNALEKLGETKGIDFDSWWHPQDIQINGSELYLDLVGSPSGTKEQDIITWVKLAGASKVSGEAVFDGGGDVDAFTF